MLRVVLLLLLAAGLQVPGGLSLSLCLCRGNFDLFHAHDAAGCCDASLAETGCCGERDQPASPEPTAQDDREPCDGCVSVTTPKRTPAALVRVDSNSRGALPPPSFAWVMIPTPSSAPVAHTRGHRQPPRLPLSVPLRI